MSAMRIAPHNAPRKNRGGFLKFKKAVESSASSSFIAEKLRIDEGGAVGEFSPWTILFANDVEPHVSVTGLRDLQAEALCAVTLALAVERGNQFHAIYDADIRLPPVRLYKYMIAF